MMMAKLCETKVRELQGPTFGPFVIRVGKHENILWFDVSVMTENFIRRLRLKFRAGGVLVDRHNTLGNAFALLGQPEDCFPVHGWHIVLIFPISLQVGFGPVENKEVGFELLVCGHFRGLATCFIDAQGVEREPGTYLVVPTSKIGSLAYETKNQVAYTEI
jgi:hypothetical protein